MTEAAASDGDVLTDLSQKPFAEILRRLAAERHSGDLQIRSGQVIKTVFFDHGRVVFAASNVKADRLGESLLAMGVISQKDFAQATALMAARKLRFGEALIATGAMDKAVLGRSIARQVRKTVLSLFDLAEGVATFEERPCGIPLEYMVSLSIHRLLYEGIASMTSETLVLAGLGNLDRWLIATPVPPFSFDPKECSAAEAAILKQARPRATIRRLAWAPGGLNLERLRAVYALLASGVLFDCENSEALELTPGLQTETGTFLLSALQHKADPSGIDLVRQEVREELARSADLDREKWLQISRQAPRAELVKALEDKMDHYHALIETAGEDQALRTDIELVLGRAASLLRLAQQERPPSKPVAPAPPLLPVTPAPPVAAVRPPAAPAQAPPASPAAAAEPAAAQAIGLEHQARYLIMEADLRMTVGDYANAVRVWEKLVQLAPDVAEYRLRLAIAMALYPRTAKMAERQFVEAVNLAPNAAECHYQFGLYYMHMKQRTRAVIELRAALRLNPRHQGAREELTQLSPKDSMLEGLRRLFK